MHRFALFVLIATALSMCSAPAAEPVAREDSLAVLKARLDVKKAEVKLTEAILSGAKRSLERVAALRKAGTVTVEEYDRSAQDAEVAAAQLNIRTAELKELEVRIEERGAVADGKAPSVAVFNMAAVMRDFEKAKYKVYVLNQKRNDLSLPLLKKREEMIALQKDIAEELDQKTKEKLAASFSALQQKFQAEEAEVNKKLNDDASAIISNLYDEIKETVDATAKANGHTLVLAYPDAVSAEEKENPYLKELKLKPPAAQPFFVGKNVDITGAVVKKLNADHPPQDKDGKKVDVNKLPLLPAPAGIPVVPGQLILPKKP